MTRAELAEIWRANAVLARAARSQIAQERYERFCQLRRGGYSIQEGAWELGITRRTADRYEARWKASRREAN